MIESMIITDLTENDTIGIDMILIDMTGGDWIKIGLIL